MMAIDENTGNKLSLSEWKCKLTNQKKKVHFSTGEDNGILKQVHISSQSDVEDVREDVSVCLLINFHKSIACFIIQCIY